MKLHSLIGMSQYVCKEGSYDQRLKERREGDDWEIIYHISDIRYQLLDQIRDEER